MKPTNLQVVAPNYEEHGTRLADLVAKIFSGFDGYYRGRANLRRSWSRHLTHYDWEASRIGLLGKRIVTHWGVYGYTMRIGGARVRAGGISAVVTHGDFRKKSYLSQTATASIEAMRCLGYDLTILFGIPNFYHHFGYVRAWAGESVSLDAGELPDRGSKVRLRRFSPKHREDIAALYNREHATATGTAVHPTYLERPEAKQWVGYYWADDRGAAAGYVILRRHGSRLECMESAGSVDDVLCALGRLARRWGNRNVRFSSLPHDSALHRHLRRGNCRVERDYAKNGGALVRTINLESTLKKMTGELSRRLRASDMARWSGRLLIADPREKVALAIDRARVSVTSPDATKHAIRGGEQIAQLLIGTHPPDETIEGAQLRLRGDARRLATILFPEQRPQLGACDTF